MARQTVVIGVDIGGTKIKAGAVEVGPDDLGTRIIESKEIPTPRLPPPAFYDAIARLVRDLGAMVERGGWGVLPCVAVAHPGRFLPGGVLARGTTPNLGSAPGQFDGLHPAHELERRLAATVLAENDAVAQMRFGIAALLRDRAIRPDLLGETVVYLGPGTGMGGGVARVSPRGEVTTVTDGHFFDMQVPACGDGTLTTEEIFTGPAIARDVTRRNARLAVPIQPATAGRIDQLLTGSAGSAEHRAEAAHVADAHGDILALLIATIHAGEITKVRLETAPDGRVIRHVDEADRAWSEQDRIAVRGARRFLFGGFVGCSVGLGGRIRRRALEVLRERGLEEMLILQVPRASADAGLLGVVTRIHRERLRDDAGRGTAATTASGGAQSAVQASG